MIPKGEPPNKKAPRNWSLFNIVIVRLQEIGAFLISKKKVFIIKEGTPLRGPFFYFIRAFLDFVYFAKQNIV
jgi:hypothetical protein